MGCGISQYPPVCPRSCTIRYQHLSHGFNFSLHAFTPCREYAKGFPVLLSGQNVQIALTDYFNGKYQPRVDDCADEDRRNKLNCFDVVNTIHELWKNDPTAFKVICIALQRILRKPGDYPEFATSLGKDIHHVHLNGADNVLLYEVYDYEDYTKIVVKYYGDSKWMTSDNIPPTIFPNNPFIPWIDRLLSNGSEESSRDTKSLGSQKTSMISRNSSKNSDACRRPSQHSVTMMSLTGSVQDELHRVSMTSLEQLDDPAS